MVSQVTSSEQVHQQVQAFPVLECVIHIHEEGTIQLSEDLPLIHDGLDTSLSYDPGLRHFFHSVYLLSLFSLYLPYFAKTTLADAVLVLEISFCLSYRDEG